MGSTPGRIIPKTLKMVPVATLLGEYIHVHVCDIRYTLTNQEGILHHNLNPRKIVETECHLDVAVT